MTSMQRRHQSSGTQWSHDVSSVSHACGRWVIQKAGAAALSSGCDPAAAARYARYNLGLFSFELSAAEMAALDGISPPAPPLLVNESPYWCPMYRVASKPPATFGNSAPFYGALGSF